MSKLSVDLSSVTAVAVDLAKRVFQVNAIDGGGKVIVVKALRRKDVLLYLLRLAPALFFPA